MNKRVIWIIELLLWIAVLAAISLTIVYLKSVDAQKHNSYYIFFHDVDGLLEGSPVRLMGMQIGYVQGIKVFENNVFVSFLVTHQNVKIPEHSTATVEFYGLGGSKSLEINPQTADDSDREFIVVKEPYRIQEFYDVQNDIAKLIVNMANNFAVVVRENEIYKTQDIIKISNKLSEANSISTKLIETLENIKIKHIKKMENENDPESADKK